MTGEFDSNVKSDQSFEKGSITHLQIPSQLAQVKCHDVHETPYQVSNRSVGVPMDNQDKTVDLQLEVIHVCERCGAEYKYSQVPEDVTITGIVECTNCGYASPLHVTIRAKGE